MRRRARSASHTAKRAKFPTFRKKGRHDRLTLSNDQFLIQDKRIRIPKLGWVRMREALRFSGHIVSATILRVADHWYVSITVDCPEHAKPSAENQGAVGVDFGVTTLATSSTGEQIRGLKALRTLLDRLQRASRNLSRKVKGSRNWRKAKLRLARLHERIANIRRNILHRLSTSITRRFSTIGIEDLNVKGMLANARLARSIADMGFHALRRQLEYKASWRGGQVVVIDRWFPGSKLCSCCGYKHEALELGTRKWSCPGCNTQHDRDVNAAIDLKNKAVSSSVSACGGEGAGRMREREATPAPKKQESKGRAGCA